MARARRRALPVRPDLLDAIVQAHKADLPASRLARDLFDRGIGPPALSAALEALTFYRFLTDRPATQWRADLTAALDREWEPLW